jgi:hypothetical protein
LKKGNRRLATKTARAMVTLSHDRFKHMPYKVDLGGIPRFTGLNVSVTVVNNQQRTVNSQ